MGRKKKAGPVADLNVKNKGVNEMQVEKLGQMEKKLG